MKSFIHNFTKHCQCKSYNLGFNIITGIWWNALTVSKFNHVYLIFSLLMIVLYVLYAEWKGIFENLYIDNDRFLLICIEWQRLFFIRISWIFRGCLGTSHEFSKLHVTKIKASDHVLQKESILSKINSKSALNQPMLGCYYHVGLLHNLRRVSNVLSLLYSRSIAAPVASRKTGQMQGVTFVCARLWVQFTYCI